ncbi:Protein of unknown function (DUF3093) [Actinosynnema pretiosum]|nr:Protein of unknown function (DUF3093) [Actinosynnema pretiosum]
MTAPTTFRERLFIPWWGWLLPLAAASLLAAEVHMGFPGVRSWLPYVIVLPLTLALIVRMGWTRVEVSGGELRVGSAHVPVRLLGEVEVVDAKAKRRVMGPELDPMAFVLHRGWVPTMVRVRLDDPEDPTPYWVFSTRSPEKLVEALRAEAAARAGTAEAAAAAAAAAKAPAEDDAKA